MRSFLTFTFLFFLILGPKFGYIDTSILVPAAICPFLVGRSLYLKPGFRFFFLSVICLICYQLLVLWGSAEFPVETVGRLIRCSVAILLVGVLLSGEQGYAWDWWIRAVVWVMAIHSVVVVLGALVPEVNRMTAVMMSDYRVREYRSSGLLAGYDIAGVLTLIGLLSTVFFREIFSSNIKIFLLLSLFLSASVFESRVTMALALFIVGLTMLRIIFDRRASLSFKLPFLLLSGVGVFLAGSYLLLVAAITFGIDFGQSNYTANSLVLRRFAALDDQSGLVDMYFLPSSVGQIIFGVGQEPGNSDVGYVREIYRYGVIGLAWAMLTHFIFVARGDYRCSSRRWRRSAIGLIACVSILLIVLTFKNNYIFVRNVFPVFLLIVGALGYKDRKSDEFRSFFSKSGRYG